MFEGFALVTGSSAYLQEMKKDQVAEEMGVLSSMILEKNVNLFGHNICTESKHMNHFVYLFCC